MNRRRNQSAVTARIGQAHTKMKKKKTDVVFVGRYVIFDAPIELLLDKSTGDSTAKWGLGPSSFITATIGGAHNSWSEVVNGLLHELLEIAFTLRRCEYLPASCLAQKSSDMYIFVARHHEFSEIVRHVADAMVYAMPDLAKKWNKERKQK
jgi:hypothetical protein